MVDHEESWLPALLVAAAIDGALTLTAIAGLVSFCVGAAGLGSILRNA